MEHDGSKGAALSIMVRDVGVEPLGHRIPARLDPPINNWFSRASTSPTETTLQRSSCHHASAGGPRASRFLTGGHYSKRSARKQPSGVKVGLCPEPISYAPHLIVSSNCTTGYLPHVVLRYHPRVDCDTEARQYNF